MINLKELLKILHRKFTSSTHIVKHLGILSVIVITNTCSRTIFLQLQTIDKNNY
jgi:hypothetical protein